MAILFKISIKINAFKYSANTIFQIIDDNNHSLMAIYSLNLYNKLVYMLNGI